jgi:hypothetical protein
METRNITAQQLITENFKFEKVETFQYVGSKVNKSNDKLQINGRIKSAKSAIMEY